MISEDNHIDGKCLFFVNLMKISKLKMAVAMRKNLIEISFKYLSLHSKYHTYMYICMRVIFHNHKIWFNSTKHIFDKLSKMNIGLEQAFQMTGLCNFFYIDEWVYFFRIITYLH